MRQKLLLRTVRQADRHRGVNHYAPLHSRNAQCMIEIIWIEKKLNDDFLCYYVSKDLIIVYLSLPLL